MKRKRGGKRRRDGEEEEESRHVPSLHVRARFATGFDRWRYL